MTFSGFQLTYLLGFCLLFLKKSFHSNDFMGLKEFPAYMHNIILVPLTGALVEDFCARNMLSFPCKSLQAVRNTSFYFTVHFYFPSNRWFFLSLSQMAALLYPPLPQNFSPYHVFFSSKYFFL